VSQSPQTAETAPDKAERYRLGWKALSELIGEGRSFSGHEKKTCFLNTRDGRFADVSVASGLGFDDDGRAVATCDWDFDGHPDIWMSNRTAPRVRLLRHAGPNTGNWLALRLAGATCNRDAIGARVVLTLSGGQTRTKSLHAGDGFLAQSGKWLHFGLGDARNVERVTIHWPGGKAERITGVRAGKHYRIVQGRGEAEVITPPDKSALKPAPFPQPPDEPGMRTWLIGRLPLPESSLIPSTGKPLLVNLWSRTCAPCVAELAEWTKHVKEIRDAGLDILALNVDALTGGSNAPPPKGFPFRSADADAALVESMELLHRTTVERQRPLPAPSSFLLDREGKVAAIYKSRAALTQLLADAALLDKSPEAQRDAAVPFPGRWASQVFPPQPLRYAETLAATGKPERRVAYLTHYLKSTPAADVQLRLGQLLLEDGRAAEAVKVMEGLFASAQTTPAFHRDAGIALLQRNLGEPARRHLLAALPAFASDPGFRFNLGIAEASTGHTEEALTQFRAVVKLDPADAAAHFQIGNILQMTRRGSEAVPHYREALRLRPGWAFPANNLAWLLATDSDPGIRDGAEALRLARAVVQADHGQNPATLSTLAAAHAETGDFPGAIAALHKAIDLASRAGDAPEVQRLRKALEKIASGEPIRAR
jgi:Flp pilus assembly protein TadD/peroxiredoxin